MPEKKKKIPPSDLRIEKIGKAHKRKIRKFHADNKELKDFLVEDAFKNQEDGISNTFVWFYNPVNELMGYVTILTDAVRIHGTRLWESFTREGIPYKTLPALKIGRLCVDKRYERKGIGREMVLFVMEKYYALLMISAVASCLSMLRENQFISIRS